MPRHAAGGTGAAGGAGGGDGGDGGGGAGGAGGAAGAPDLTLCIPAQFCIYGRPNDMKFHAGEVSEMLEREMGDFLHRTYDNEGLWYIEGLMRDPDVEAMYRDSAYGTEPLQNVLDAIYALRMGGLRFLSVDELAETQIEYRNLHAAEEEGTIPE